MMRDSTGFNLVPVSEDGTSGRHSTGCNIPFGREASLTPFGHLGKLSAIINEGS